MSDQTFEVLSPLHFDGQRYGVGEKVKMAAERAEYLVRAGCLKPGPIPAPSKAKAKKPSRKPKA